MFLKRICIECFGQVFVSGGYYNTYTNLGDWENIWPWLTEATSVIFQNIYSQNIWTLQHLNSTLYNYIIILFKHKKKITEINSETILATYFLCHSLLTENNLFSPLDLELNLYFNENCIVSFSTFSVIEVHASAIDSKVSL